MFSTIVVGFDGTDEAEDGLAFAGRLAEVTGGRLVLAFAYGGESIAVGIGSASIGVRMHEEAREVLRRGLKLLPEGVRAEMRALRHASPARGLHELAQELDADLIVLGPAQFGPLGRVVVGSVAMRLLHGSACPVAVAPKGYARDDRQPRGRIGVCWDGSAESQLALETAGELARLLGAEVRLWHAVDPRLFAHPSYPGVYVTMPTEAEMTESAREALDQALKSVPADVKASAEPLVGNVANSLAAQAADEAVDLMVTGSRGYGPLRRVLLGDVSSTLVHEAPCPILIVPRSAIDAPLPEAQPEPAAP